jgi:hypothetical protein
MDFIERFFGQSPDNGDGSTEILWFIVLATLLLATFWWRQRRAVTLAISKTAAPTRSNDDTATQPKLSFTCIARTRVGDHEVVLVTVNCDLTDADAVGLRGTMAYIDGAQRGACVRSLDLSKLL